MEKQGHGLQLNPIVENDHYVLGGYSGVSNRPILMPNGHGWGAFKPKPEVQNKNGLETMNCTNYGTDNALETLASFHEFDAFPKDCSERYGGITTGTTKYGNDPHEVIEKVRKEVGVIPEVVLPFNQYIETWEDYYSPNPVGALSSLGKKILEKFKIQHDWVFNSREWSESKIEALKKALEVGTVCVSVTAWKQRKGLFYKEDNDADNHWLQLLDYKEGKVWKVYDHYEQAEKDLEWHYNFNAAKVYYMERITEPTKRNFWDIVWDLFRVNKLLGFFRAA